MKRAVITGMSRGLGLALATELEKSDWKVQGCSRSAPPPHQVDVSDWPQVSEWARVVIGEHGPPHLLVCNAAVVNPLERLWEIEVEDFHTVIDINLKGVFHTIKAFLPPMLEAGRGVVVTLSSGWGRTTSPRVAPYCCTKFGIEGLTRSLSQELPKSMAAVAVNPGTIHTEMLERAFGSMAQRFPGADSWARVAVPFLIDLGPEHNGRSLDVPPPVP